VRRLFVTSAVMFLVFIVVEDICGEVKYNVTDLGTLGGNVSSAYGINNSGQIVGGARTSSGAHHAFLYSGGTMIDLGTLGGTASQARSINNHGQVVGYAENASGNPHAFLFSGNGPMQDLGTLGGVSIAYGINDSGDVVGYSTGSPSTRAFIYSGSGPMQSMGTLPNGSISTAFAINNNRQTVGYADSSLLIRAFVCNRNGPLQDLGVLADRKTWATSINDTGLIAGYYQYSSVHEGFLYNSNTGVVESMGAETEASDVNNLGQVVGHLRSYVGGSSNHAMLYSDGKMQDLNSLIPSSSGWGLNEAYAINDNGWIVGSGGIGGRTHAFLLTPIPEPSTLVLLGVGAVGLLTYGWRRRRGASRKAVTDRMSSIVRGCMLAAPTMLALVSSGLAGSMPGSGDIFAADYWMGVVRRYSVHDSTYEGIFCSRTQGLVGLAFLPDGDLVVASSIEDKVLRYDTLTANFKGVIFQTQIDNPRGVVAGPDGTLWISALNSGALVRVDPDTGTELSRAVVSRPMAVASGNGRIYVTSQTVGAVHQYEAMTGDYLGVLVSGLGLNPQAIAVCSDGSLIVNSSNLGIFHIDQHDGHSLGFLEGFGGEGIAVGLDGMAYAKSIDGALCQIDPTDMAVNRRLCEDFLGWHGIAVYAIPEPSALLLLSFGTIGLMGYRCQCGRRSRT
jgi:probable HAF family extracellular repeat protein